MDNNDKIGEINDCFSRVYGGRGEQKGAPPRLYRFVASLLCRAFIAFISEGGIWIWVGLDQAKERLDDN